VLLAVLQAHSYTTPREFLDLSLNASDSRKRFHSLWKRRSQQQKSYALCNHAPTNVAVQPMVYADGRGNSNGKFPRHKIIHSSLFDFVFLCQ